MLSKPWVHGLSLIWAFLSSFLLQAAQITCQSSCTVLLSSTYQDKWGGWIISDQGLPFFLIFLAALFPLKCIFFPKQLLQNHLQFPPESGRMYPLNRRPQVQLLTQNTEQHGEGRLGKFPRDNRCGTIAGEEQLVTQTILKANLQKNIILKNWQIQVSSSKEKEKRERERASTLCPQKRGAPEGHTHHDVCGRWRAGILEGLSALEASCLDIEQWPFHLQILGIKGNN